MLATVKSRLMMVGVTPSGSLVAEMWIERPISSPSRLNSKKSGILSAGAITSTSWRTMLSTPPRLSPGDSASLTKRTGTLTRMRAPGATRWKSTWMGMSLMGSSCTSRGMTRVLLPSTSRSNKVERNLPRPMMMLSSLASSAIVCGAPGVP